MAKLAVVFAEGFADWECAHLMGAGRSHLGLEIATATPGGNAVTSLGGLKIVPDVALEDIHAEGFDGIVFCGGTIWRSGNAPEISRVVGEFMQSDKLVAAICDAVFGLAGTGVLDTARHTGNAPDSLKSAAAYKGEGSYVDSPAAVTDGSLITASGAAPVSFMVEVLSGLGFSREMLKEYQGILAAEHKLAA